jgi:hypothetical protein
MKGWLTKTAGALLILYGIIGAISGLHDFDSAFLMVGNGLGYIGLRRNQDTIKADIIAAQVSPPSIDDIVRRNQ